MAAAPPSQTPGQTPEKERRPAMLSADRIRLQLEKAQRHLDTARSHTGRVATVTGTAAVTTGLFTDVVMGESLLVTLAATGLGLLVLPTGKARQEAPEPVLMQEPDGSLRIYTPEPEPSHQAWTASVLYVLPGVGLAGVLIAEHFVSGFHWGEAVAAALWAAGTWLLRPARRARHMLVPPPPRADHGHDLVAADEPQMYAHPAAQWWAERVAIEGGAAPATVLEDIEKTGETSMRAIIRASAPGEPVPDISVRRLSALMDVPQDLITVGPVPGRGAAVQMLTVGRADADALDPATVWAERIAPLAMPGASITAINFGSMSKEDA
ncbi:hypothetical protein [Streptomyces sp. NPDC091217]|uniref:hypothetical protein n=1 Tax=Streptomyces sp. NPDC091217 TaxID=3365975 RepID=UPI003812CAF5